MEEIKSLSNKEKLTLNNTDFSFNCNKRYKFCEEENLSLFNSHNSYIKELTRYYDKGFVSEELFKFFLTEFLYNYIENKIENRIEFSFCKFFKK